MFGGLIVLNQGRRADGPEPGLNKTLAKAYVKETPKHGRVECLGVTPLNMGQ